MSKKQPRVLTHPLVPATPSSTGEVYALIQLSDGTLLAGTRKVISQWSLEESNSSSLVCVHSLEGHQDAVVELVDLPGRDSFVSSSWDKTIKLWSHSSKECIGSFVGHSDACNVAIVLKCKKDVLVTGADDNSIKMWNIDTRTCIKTLYGHLDEVVALCELRDEKLASGSFDWKINIWDIKSGECIRSLSGHQDWVRGVVEMKDGAIMSASNDRTVRVWNGKRCTDTLPGHTSHIRKLVGLRNGTTVVSLSNDKSVRGWDREGHCLFRCELELDEPYSAVELQNGTLAVGSSSGITIWKIPNKRGTIHHE
eukprot:TRINITY_DN8306_c0_g1_i1.p1 TRINITY_DN8306_c0_g1~~TRINITY_DN8306_c0_g1_i1.p1  ORF type:complete len:310 (+),score=50.75 TRINITY_DN8306_c0_g1_i1:143-1072(+)